MLALEKPDAANKRFFTVGGYFTNRDIAEIIKRHFPQYKDLPSASTPGGDYPEGGKEKGVYGYDNKRTIEVLGLKYRSFEDCIIDCIVSFQSKGL